MCSVLIEWVDAGFHHWGTSTWADFAVSESTVSGKKLALLLPSTSGTSEAGRKLPTKCHLYHPYWLYPCRINTQVQAFFKATSFFLLLFSFWQGPWAQHGSIRNACNTTSTYCMTWSPQDLVDRIEGGGGTLPRHERREVPCTLQHTYLFIYSTPFFHRLHYMESSRLG